MTTIQLTNMPENCREDLVDDLACDLGCYKHIDNIFDIARLTPQRRRLIRLENVPRRGGGGGCKVFKARSLGPCWNQKNARAKLTEPELRRNPKTKSEGWWT